MSILENAKPICACGTTSRLVVNGVSDRLNYWYCDTCKDEPKNKPIALILPEVGQIDEDALRYTISGSFVMGSAFYGAGSGSHAPPPVPPQPQLNTGAPPHVWGIDKNAVKRKVYFSLAATPCFHDLMTGELVHKAAVHVQSGLCACGEVSY